MTVRRLAGLVLALGAGVSACSTAAPDNGEQATSATVTSTLATVSSTSPTTSTIVERVPVWADEFDGAAGAPPDPSRWAFDIGGTGWGNAQLEYYSASNAVTDGAGHLNITSHALDVTTAPSCWYGACHFMSSRLTTAGIATWKYGRFEIRAAFPEGEATWPAFWMLGADVSEVGWPATGEIDVVEHVGRDGAKVRGTAHGPGYSAEEGVTASTSVADVADFHVYAVEWSASSIVWFVDGVEYHRIDAGNARRWVFDHDFFLVLNLAMGGQLGGEPAAGDFQPKTLTVDYVRVYAP